MPRRSSEPRSRPRQPRSGDGSVRLMTSGRMSVPALLAQRAVEAVDGRVVGVDRHDGAPRARPPRASTCRRCSRGPRPAPPGWRAAAARTNSALRPASSSLYVLVSPYSVQAVRPGLNSSRRTSFSSLRRFASSSCLPKPALLSSLLDLAAAGVGVARLEPGVEDDVREHAALQPVAREHAPGLARRDPVERAAQPGVVRRAAVGLQHQRIQEEHAELAVAGPRLARPKRLERADVDEHRRRRRANWTL